MPSKNTASKKTTLQQSSFRTINGLTKIITLLSTLDITLVMYKAMFTMAQEHISFFKQLKPSSHFRDL